MRTAIPLVLFALAAWFVLGPAPGSVALPPAARVDAADIDTAPLRTLPENPAIVDVGGTPLSCNECHRLFPTKPEASATLMQHTHIVLDHGLNDRCLNCHALDDREKLVLHGGELVGFDEVPSLCAKCHGTTWRDWQQGIHGRTNGSWEPSGERRRLACNECHDPHAPAFGGLAPLPGPATLRMGTPSTHHPTGPLVPWRGTLDQASHEEDGDG